MKKQYIYTSYETRRRHRRNDKIASITLIVLALPISLLVYTFTPMGQKALAHCHQESVTQHECLWGK